MIKLAIDTQYKMGMLTLLTQAVCGFGLENAGLKPIAVFT